jgi:tryptophan halogenase
MESYQFIYYGMMKDIQYHHKGSFPDTEKAKLIFEQIDKMTKQALIELPNHRELINKIYEFGMQKI